MLAYILYLRHLSVICLNGKLPREILKDQKSSFTSPEIPDYRLILTEKNTLATLCLFLLPVIFIASNNLTLLVLLFVGWSIVPKEKYSIFF